MKPMFLYCFSTVHRIVNKPYKPRFRTVLALFLGALTKPLFLYGQRMNKRYKPVGAYGFLTQVRFFKPFCAKSNSNSSNTTRTLNSV